MAKVQKTEKIWMDGKLVNWVEANLHILTHSLHYGLAPFEGIRAYQTRGGGTAVFRLEDHMRRLDESARIGLMKLPYDVEELCSATVETLAANRLKAGYIRPIAFYGAGVMGLLPGDNPVHVAIVVWPWGSYLGEEGLEKGIRVKISSFNRLALNVSMTKAKFSGNYINSILAKQEVIRSGYDEALLLDATGYVSEGPGENIFLVKNGRVKTPPPGSILLGITRDSILRLCGEMGIPAEEQNFTRDELYAADEAFFTGTAAELTPIREVDDRPIGNNGRGPITRKLQEQFFRILRGESPRHRHWLTSVKFPAPSKAQGGRKKNG